jgi:hypothetical protein
VNEPEVVQRVHRFLMKRGIDGTPTPRLFTDPHPTLTGLSALRPFQRFRIDVGGLVAHPDLFGQEDGQGSLFAIEAKGLTDHLKGLAQAEFYQQGVQRSFLAAPGQVWTDGLLEQARQKGVGVLAVGEEVKVLHRPTARRPLNALYNALLADLVSAACVSEQATYTYNLPTHYLVWALVLPARGLSSAAQASELLSEGYPLPKDWRAAVRGAQKLGIVEVSGQGLALTDIGRAIRDLMPRELGAWSTIHKEAASRLGRPLVDLAPQAAAGLRLLLLQDPVVRLVMEGLRSFEAKGASFRQLAVACSQLDQSRTSIFFLKPEAAARWVGPGGSAPWQDIPGSDFRSTTFFQYKSILKHAGLIAPVQLGNATATNYNADLDWWIQRETTTGQAGGEVNLLNRPTGKGQYA